MRQIDEDRHVVGCLVDGDQVHVPVGVQIPRCDPSGPHAGVKLHGGRESAVPVTQQDGHDIRHKIHGSQIGRAVIVKISGNDRPCSHTAVKQHSLIESPVSISHEDRDVIGY